ncbi:uncharacterized protein LOC120655160 isoform X2 [Panicum virgatum]|uniref:Uncharacterized protein n=1 Tax=Panicum virgatum TaxID=38727 RepID=A0A8T0X286_PANVG|nr:uncharacterized protein LOC120655160 isoform X2 [Panicum virgatum]KAG2649639.1 hypothetical protein PVAP13_1NG122300 [Panicum virgatum]
MACPKHLWLLFSKLICFAATLTSMMIYSWNVGTGRIRIRAFNYMYLALMLQISVCTLELMFQSMSIYFGSTTPAPNHLLLCLLLIIGDWVLALFTVGTACTKDQFIRSVVVRAMIHCVLSLAAGVSAVVAAFLTSEIGRSPKLVTVKHRRRYLRTQMRV